MFTEPVGRAVSPSRARVDSVLVVLLGLSLAVNVALAYRLHQSSSLTPRPVTSLTAGQTVAAVQAQGLDGIAAYVSYAETKENTLLYVFNTGCQWCQRNVANINAIAAAKPAGARIIGLASDVETGEVKDYVLRNNIEFPVFLAPTAKTVRDYHLESVPLTILVGPKGKVLRVWQGAFTGTVGEEIATYFSIRLPGLTGSR